MDGSDNQRFFIHPDSLPLLQARGQDIIRKRANGITPETVYIQSNLKPQAFDSMRSQIIQRNEIAFMFAGKRGSMTPDEMRALERRVAQWAASPVGKQHLEECAARCRQMQADAEQKRRDDIRWWHEIKDKPVTI
jgi:hypothetical protein